MQELAIFSQVVLYVLLVLFGLYLLLIGGWQIKVLRGAAMSIRMGRWMIGTNKKTIMVLLSQMFSSPVLLV